MLDLMTPGMFYKGTDWISVAPVQEAGWVTVRRSPCGLGTCGWATPTKSGEERTAHWIKVWCGWRIPIAKREFSEITGIETSSPNAAIAHYSWRWVPTQEGQLRGLKASSLQDGQSTLKLFDDGWRVTDSNLARH